MEEKNEFLESMILNEFVMDSNNLSGFKFDSSCSYSKEGDCSNCCEMELVIS